MSWYWRALLLLPFGHGRMMEAYLAMVCAISATTLIFFPQELWKTVALSDLGWTLSGWVFSIPFAAKAILTGTGLWLNVYGFRISRHFRVAGAMVGFGIWFWLSVKLSAVGTLLFAWAFCIPSTYASVRIIIFACLNLPAPGAPARYV